MTKAEIEKLLLLADRAHLRELGVPGESVSVEYNQRSREMTPILCRALLAAWALIDYWERIGPDEFQRYSVMAAELRAALAGEEAT